MLILDPITAHQIAIRLDSLDVPDDALFRVYYRIMHAEGTAHRRHGDLKKVH